MKANMRFYPAEQIVKEARLQYFSDNGIPVDGGLNEKWARYQIGPFSLIGFPNFQHRMDAILRHDLHHIILNLDTSSKGEGLIAAWELGSGCGRYWLSWCMEPQALWWGILMAPRRTIELFALGKRSNNFFHQTLPNNYLSLSVGELRKQILPSGEKNLSLAGWLHFFLMAGVGVLMITLFIPIFAFFTTFGVIASLISRIKN